MGLDINTPKGQESLGHEHEARQQFLAAHPDCSYVETPKNEPGIVDAVIVRNNEIIAVIECKARNLTQSKLNEFGTWLITWEKVQQGIKLGKDLCVPFIGFLWLIPEQTLLVIPISHKNGQLVNPITIEATTTQKTINGGTVERNNAYIPIKGARVVPKTPKALGIES